MRAHVGLGLLAQACFSRSLPLCHTAPFLQVVGRLSAGRDLLPLLNAMKTDVNDVPQHRVKVARCGFTDAGKHSMQLAWVGATKDARHLCSLERCVAEL